MAKKLLIFFLVIATLSKESIAQNRKTDSILNLIKTDKEDSIKAIHLLNIGNEFLATSIYDSAISFYNKTLLLSKKVEFKKGIGVSLENIGYVYFLKANYPKALEFELNSLKIYESIGNNHGIASCYNTIGDIYRQQSNLPKALEYQLQSLKIREKIGEKGPLAASYIDIGNLYLYLENYPKALEYYFKELKICEDVVDKNIAQGCYMNIGNVYANQANYPKALFYYFKDLKISKEKGDKESIGKGYGNLGSLYFELGDYKKALEYEDSSLHISKEIGDINTECFVYRDLANVYAKTGRYKEAYGNYVNYKTMTDSIYNSENNLKLADLANNFEAEKREVIQEKKDAISKEQKKQQQLIIYSVIGILIIVMVFSFFIYRRFKITQKQKAIIEVQKHLVEEHQKEIVDSITYAKRLQQAILPSIKAIKEQLSDSFIYYQPKDTVAGDFYWMHTTREAVYIAAADCTGHGVPGAMVSVVCSNALNRAVNEFNLTDTGLILDKTRELVIETFEKSDSEVKDGMDISLLRIQNSKNENKEIQWSGANNSLWYILNNELIEVKADKQPIGKYSEPIPFTTNTFNFNSSVSFYLFSDGYADQFGENDKKLMKKKFKDIVLSMQDLSMLEQKNKIEKVHVDWKGTMEQTDDVLVIGIKI